MKKQHEKELNDLISLISKSLIATMKTLDLKTHIEMTSVSDGYRYKLKFDREKINKQI